MTRQRKSITLNLYNGAFNDIASASIKLSNFIVCSATKEKILDQSTIDDDVKKYLKHAGIYILIGIRTAEPCAGNTGIYIGQATRGQENRGMLRRITEHNPTEEIIQIYDKAYFLTTKDNSLTETDLNYIEKYFISKAHTIEDKGRWDVLNGTRGVTPSVSDFDIPILNCFYFDTSILLSTLGLQEFNDLNIDSNVSPLATASAEVTTDELPSLFVSLGTLYYKSIHNDDFDAKARFTQSGHVILLKDSKLRAEDINSPQYANYHSIRERFKDFIEIVDGNLVTNTDIEFDSPSGAACFVNARSTNGWQAWKDINGKCLNEHKIDG